MDSKQYIKRTNYINVLAVAQLPPDQRKFVIASSGWEKIFKNTKDGVVTEDPKLQLPLTHLSGAPYEWTPSYDAIDTIAQATGSYETQDWIGLNIELGLRPNNKGGNSITVKVLR